MKDILGVELENIYGQSYDGTASMTGQYTGLQNSEKTTYIYCHAHICIAAIEYSCVSYAPEG